jgi:para-nitrobenzyl esterase
MRSMVRMVAGLALAAGLCAGAAWADPVKVRVDSGSLAGESADGVNAFKGVPYAAPPVGDLRWRAPQPVAAWQGDRAATAFGAGCMQAGGRGGQLSEDCLYLNVYAPPGARNAPVMVWIHGGSNTGGSGSIYNGAAFAKQGIVTVTLNYRLGALGFFAHPAITAAAGASDPLANYGLMDQTAALQWVQRNIAAFGGDPRKVTVFGESAGAIDIYALLGARSSRGLFSQAILESNITWGESASLATAETQGRALAVRAGATETASLADLRAIPADKLIAAAQGAQFPMVDGRFMTEGSLAAMAAGHTVDVPLIVGSNSFEASLVQRNMPEATWTNWTNSQAGAPARFIAAKSATGAPSWLYFFSYVPEARRATSPGAAHASEIPYVFGGSTRPPGAPAPTNVAATPGATPAPAAAPAPPAQTPEDIAMASLMHSCWVAFAKTGTPTCGSTPWPAYTPATDRLMEFGAPSGVRTNFRKAELDAAQAAQAGAR